MLSRSRTDDKPSAAKALKRKDAEIWHSAMWTEICALQQFDCWKEVARPRNTKVLHTKLVLWRKHNEEGMIGKHKARLVVCANEESDNDNDCFIPVEDYILIKMLLCFAVQRKWEVKRFDFQNAFPNGILDRSVLAKLPRHCKTIKFT